MALNNIGWWNNSSGDMDIVSTPSIAINPVSILTWRSSTF